MYTFTSPSDLRGLFYGKLYLCLYIKVKFAPVKAVQAFVEAEI
jgi:hypothetical protein